MAGIPLFTPDYLSSPTMFGAISPTTARIMSETGKQIADTIEKNNAKLEAHAKAPQIASLMGEGLKRLSDGDMSGFQILSQAQSVGASNPFLMKMTQDAISTGGSMARNYMDNEIARTRYTGTDNNRDESALALLDRQALDDHRSRVGKIQSEYEKEVEKYNKDLAGFNRMRELGDTSVTPPTPPKKPEVPPPPTMQSRVYGGAGAALPSQGQPALPTRGGAPLPPTTPGAAPAPSAAPVGPKLPFGHKAMPVMAEDSGLFNTLNVDEVPVIADQAPPPTDPAATSQPTQVDALPVKDAANPIMANSETSAPKIGEPGAVGAPQDPSLTADIKPEPSPSPSPTETPESKPLVNENEVKPKDGIDVGKPRQPAASGDNLVIPFGQMNWRIPTPAAKQMRVSETVQTSTGSKTYTLNPGKDTERDNAVQLAQLMTSVDSMDHKFSDWYSSQAMQGKKVTVEPDPTDPKRPWIAKSNGEPMGDESQPGVITPHPIAPQVGEAWNKAIQLFPTVKPAKEFPPTKARVAEMDAKQIERVRKGEATLDEINAARKKAGFDPLPADKVPAKAGPVDPEVKKSLEKRGIKDPTEKPKEKGPKDDTVESLNRQIADLSKKLAMHPELYETIAALEKKRLALESKREKDFSSMVEEGMVGVN